MQRYTTIALFSAIALSVGILGVYGLTSVPSTLNAQSSPQNTDGVPLLGHVTMTVTDPKGDIVAYHQGDNIVVRQAEDCLSEKIFGASNADCPTGGTSYTAIAIGNGTQTQVATRTSLAAEIDTQDPTLDRKSATITPTQSTGSAAASDLLQATFTNGGATTNTISESGIFNSTAVSSVGMFAYQTFTGIPLNSGDSLTVKWTVTIGT